MRILCALALSGVALPGLLQPALASAQEQAPPFMEQRKTTYMEIGGRR